MGFSKLGHQVVEISGGSDLVRWSHLFEVNPGARRWGIRQRVGTGGCLRIPR